MSCCDKKNEINEVELKLEGLICYCFKHSIRELYDAVKAGSENEIIDDIKKKMKDPGCFCETENPSGKCCMGDVMGFIKGVKNESK